jgi:hypothetical protein
MKMTSVKNKSWREWGVIAVWLAVCIPSTTLHAQNWNEWFRQEKTQERYLIRQIALLQVYLGYLKEGIIIAQQGLNTIHQIKEGDFNLHRDFFGSLKKVNPHIANSAKVADIIAYQVFIIGQLRRVNAFCQNNDHFTPREARYVAEVYANMMVLSDASLAELLSIVRSNETEMQDSDRMQRIDRLYTETLDRHAFSNAFSNEVHFIATERENQAREIQDSHARLNN